MKAAVEIEMPRFDFSDIGFKNLKFFTSTKLMVNPRRIIPSSLDKNTSMRNDPLKTTASIKNIRWLNSFTSTGDKAMDFRVKTGISLLPKPIIKFRTNPSYKKSLPSASKLKDPKLEIRTNTEPVKPDINPSGIKTNPVGSSRFFIFNFLLTKNEIKNVNIPVETKNVKRS